MRTKILLAAAAALIAGVVASNAQVYSANIVGYAVTANSKNGQFVLLANPLDASQNGGNVLTNLFPGINGGTTVQVWNGTGFDVYKFSAGSWQNTANSTNANNFALPPGQGFFVQLGGAKSYTNTFTGQVVPGQHGTSVTNLIMPGLQLVGSLVPYADYVTNTSTINLIAKGGTTLQQWDQVGQQFIVYKFSAGAWQNLNTSLAEVPFINVSQGFFFQPNGTTSNVWVEASP